MTTPTQAAKGVAEAIGLNVMPTNQALKLLAREYLDLQRRLAAVVAVSESFVRHARDSGWHNTADELERLTREAAQSQQEEAKMEHDPECELGDHGNGACGKGFRPKPGERAVLVSSSDGEDQTWIGRTFEIVELPGEHPHSHYGAKLEPQRQRVQVCRDAVWRPVEAETKAEAPAGEVSDEFLLETYRSTEEDGLVALRCVYNAGLLRGRMDLSQADLRQAYDKGAESVRAASHIALEAKEAEVAELRRELAEVRQRRDLAQQSDHDVIVSLRQELAESRKERPVPSREALALALFERAQSVGAINRDLDWDEAKRRAKGRGLTQSYWHELAEVAEALFSLTEPSQAAATLIADKGPINEASTDRAKLEAHRGADESEWRHPGTGRLLAASPIPATDQRLNALERRVAELEKVYPGTKDN